ncbi:MAG: DUF4124 domain-containing protein [Pseudomonas sp.]|uniref:DUF4124 domain-containing protein n=1 Tax=Stutzerimonas degradans TaxID=2968968 RepID=UPI00028D4A15|nr:DUF4124 domain-containing protein [Stutzerimonas degradans]EKM93685.1 hypothetical protein C211_22299 [Stutzerimonas degradans]MEB2326286.1 DUF4124 domain-containing protein [Pseudomonas sp.]NHC11366.1 DUF4124 domain-containing protein [Stutzerimonas degradans]
MHYPLSATLFAFAILISQAPAAATVFRCTDEAGRITYAQQGCPGGTDIQKQQAYNPTPGSGKAVKMATTNPRSTRKATPPPTDQLTIVAERHDGCGNRISGGERREAIIKQRILSGMTRSDVESALGRPSSVLSTNGRTRYRYEKSEGRARTVTFDEKGCVTGKR